MVDVAAIAEAFDLVETELIAMLESADYRWVKAAEDWMHAQIRCGADPADIVRVMVFLSGTLCGAAFRTMNVKEPVLIYETIGRHFMEVASYVARRKAAP